MRSAASVIAILAFALCAAIAQAQPARTFRVAYLGFSSAGRHADFVGALKVQLRQRGYVEGRNLVFLEAYGDNDSARLQAAAHELVRAQPDLIITPASRSTSAARQATSTIPIVMLAVSDPVGAGFVKELRRPGGNVTGLVNLAPDTAAKLLELLLTVAPSIKSIGLIATDNPAAVGVNELTAAAARARGIPVQQPTKFLLVVNPSAAKSIGLELPQQLLLRADKVVH